MTSAFVVTVDLDWACEPAIEGLLSWLEVRRIPYTVFTTHRSEAVEARLPMAEVGLHPNFAPGSSHGKTTAAVVEHVLGLPHNLLAVRCHRFEHGNDAMEALAAAGMRVSSNVCTDMDSLRPFRNRYGMTEVPIFFEDGGYLRLQRPLDIDGAWRHAAAQPGPKVLLLHPMHWALNSPNFGFMRQIKDTLSPHEWNQLSANELADVRWKGRGIRTLVEDVLEMALNSGVEFTTIGRLTGLREVDDATAL
jgi:hypothetical protein